MRSDWELVRAWARNRSGEAFAEIVRRHGEMVYGTCFRVLREAHAAEDAAQATFMVLSTKAASLRRTVDLACWLHVVGRRAALMAARGAARRKLHEEEAAMRKAREDGDGAKAASVAVRARLDSELARLPGRERQAVILRYLENRSEAEAAGIAGCPVGTLSRRASQGMARLRDRLAGRGVALGAGALAGMLVSAGAVPAPATLLPSLLAAPELAAGGLGSTEGTAGMIAKGVTRAMFMTKAKITAIAACAVLVVGIGTPVTYRALRAAEKTGAGKGARAPETELGRLAASLKPGEMKRLKVKGYTRDVLKSWYKWDHDEKGTRIYGAQKMFNVATSWSHDAKWDPVSRQVLFIGIGHYAALKFLTYSDATNTWTLMPVPTQFDPRQIECKVKEVLPEKRLKLSAGKAQGMWPEASLDIFRDGKIVGEARVVEVGGNESVAVIRRGAGAIKANDTARNRNPSSVGYDKKTKRRTWTRGHTYDRLAISPEHRMFAINWHGLYTYNMEEREWSRKPVAPAGGKDALQVAEYFPDMKAFVYTRSWGKEMLAWDPETKKVRSLPSGRRFGMHGVMEYNPFHKVLLLGGGDGCKNLYSMDASGKVRKLKNSPIAFTCKQLSKFLCDPVSGEVLVQEDLKPQRVRTRTGWKHKLNNRTFAFHPVRNEWREIPGLRLPIGLGVAIDTYGVLMFCTGGQVFVYKHKPVFTEGKAK